MLQANETIVMRDPFSEPQGAQTSEGEGLGIINTFGSGFRRSPDSSVKVPKLLFKGFVDRGRNAPPMALLQVTKAPAAALTRHHRPKDSGKVYTHDVLQVMTFTSP